MQSKVTLVNSNQNWSQKRRYKINNVVSYLGSIYQNSTGINTDPLLLTDWVLLNNASTPIIMDGIIGVTAGFIVGQTIFTLPAGAKCIGVHLAHAKQYKTTSNNASLANRWSQTGNDVTITKSPVLNNYIYIEFIL